MGGAVVWAGRGGGGKKLVSNEGGGSFSVEGASNVDNKSIGGGGCGVGAAFGLFFSFAAMIRA